MEYMSDFKKTSQVAKWAIASCCSTCSNIFIKLLVRLPTCVKRNRAENTLHCRRENLPLSLASERKKHTFTSWLLAKQLSLPLINRRQHTPSRHWLVATTLETALYWMGKSPLNTKHFCSQNAIRSASPSFKVYGQKIWSGLADKTCLSV